MNRYDQLFDFRIANKNDIDAIMCFIKKYWSHDHILANSREFFEYHYGGSNNDINVFLMCQKDGQIVGMIGFVPYSNNPEKKYISCSIIKVIETLPLPMCGVELMKRFFDYLKPFTEFGCGANTRTILPIYEKIFKRYSGILKQYYLLNPKRKDFKIITVSNCETDNIEYVSKHPYTMIKMRHINDIEFDFEKRYKNLPYKEKTFLAKRYFQHPVFTYDVYGIRGDNGYKGIIFTRKISYNGSSIILIVDFVGEIHCLGNISKELKRILVEENAECISFLESGIPPEILENSGFHLLDPMQNQVIIPTYFEPFANVNITNSYISMEKDLIIFKATGDQDNPKYMLQQ